MGLHLLSPLMAVCVIIKIGPEAGQVLLTENSLQGRHQQDTVSANSLQTPACATIDTASHHIPSTSPKGLGIYPESCSFRAPQPILPS